MPARTTELDAVNQILRMLGRRPVNSLDPADQTPDSAFALAELRAQSRAVQAMGWHFNTNRSVKFTPDGNDEIPLTDDVLRADTAKRYSYGDRGVDPITRRDPSDGQWKLYDTRAHLRDEDPFKFTRISEIRLDLVVLLDFEDTPEAFRRYVSIRAGRAVQGVLISDPALHRFSLDDEIAALTLLRKEETDTRDANFFKSYETGRIVARRSPIDRLESI